MGIFFGIIAFLCFIAFAIFQIYAGYIGIEHYLGSIWASIFLVGLFIFRFSLPFTLGAFFCTINIWNWNWFLALLFVIPGLAFIIPGVLAFIISSAKQLFLKEKKSNIDYEDHSTSHRK